MLSGVDMLVSSRVLGEGGSVNAGLGGEGRGPDIGRMAVGRAIEQFVEGARDVRKSMIWRKASGVTPVSKRYA